MKNMLNFKNFTAEELKSILELAMDMKKDPAKYAHALEGKKLYTLFEKTSTRTFLSFTTGITEMGGSYFNQLWRDSNFVLGEPVSEIKYVCRNVDIIMARLVKNETVELFGENVTVPFINGCDNSYHPCQILADMLDEDGTPIQVAPHAQQLVRIHMDQPVEPWTILRRDSASR